MLCGNNKNNQIITYRLEMHLPQGYFGVQTLLFSFQLHSASLQFKDMVLMNFAINDSFSALYYA